MFRKKTVIISDVNALYAYRFFFWPDYISYIDQGQTCAIQLLEYAKKNSQNLGNNIILSFSQTQFVNMCGLNKSTLLFNTYLHVYYLVVHLSLDLFSHIFTSDTTQSLIQKKYLCFLYLGQIYFFCQITTFIKVRLAFVFGLQTL